MFKLFMNNSIIVMFLYIIGKRVEVNKSGETVQWRDSSRGRTDHDRVRITETTGLYNQLFSAPNTFY